MRNPLIATVLVVLPLVSEALGGHRQQRRLGHNQRLRPPMSGLGRPQEQSTTSEVTGA